MTREGHYYSWDVRLALSPNGSLLYGPLCRFGSLFIFQGPYFQCFDYIYAENINSVCNAESA